MCALLRQSSPEVPPEMAGQWIAWNREQTKIVGCGATFEEAKQRAAEAGESAVFLAKAPSGQRWLGHGRRVLYMVAVFISLAQSAGDAVAAPRGTLLGQTPASADASQTIADFDDVDDSQDTSAESQS